MRRLWPIAALVMVPLMASAQGLVLGNKAPAAPPPQSCLGVTAGTATSFGCINEAQKALVEQHREAVAAEGLHPGSPATALGLYDHAATKQQFGDAFGRSVVPQRPPPPVFNNPVGPAPR